MKSGHHLIGLMTGESPKLLVGMLAILKSGAGFVPIDPAYPQERISFIVQDCGLETLLTESRYLELARRIAETHASLKRIVCLDDLTVEEVKPAGVEIHDRSDWLQRPATNVVARVEPEQTVYVIYTSGSTGQPKGVPISHRNLVPLLLWSREFFNLGEHTKALQNLSYCFDFGVFEILTTVVFGGTLYFPGTNGSHKTSTSAAYVEEHAINTIHTTPSYFREIISLGGTLKSLETLHLGGEALTKSTVDYIFDVVDDDCTVYNGYGPTEASVNCSIMKVGTRRAHWHDEHSSVPIGRVSANNQLYVLDKNCEPVPVGVAGELHVGGAGLAAGYLNRPQLTAEKFIPHPFTDEPGARLYRSGDLARYHLDGNIEFLGRLDDQIKVRGYRIELGEIEAALAQHPSVAEAVVMPHDGATGARRLVAYLVHKQGENGATVGELRSFLKAKLPEYMVPSAFMKLESLPLTSSGKIDRRALPAPDQSRPELEEAFEAPRSLVEEVIAGICGEVLGIERVGVNDNLFDLGCHSLLATKIVARVREAVGVELALTSFFESPTVAELTAICDEAKLAETNLQLPPIRHAERNNGHLPLSFAQERIWFLDQLTSHNTSYYIPRALRIKGPLNVKVVEDTFTELLRRHEILRTSFPAVEGRPVQVIHPPEPFHATLIDLRHLADDERESKVRQIILEEGQRTFDLAVAPLLRVTLLRVEQDEFVLILTEHHLIHDGWTQGILLGEFLTLYTSLAAGEPSPLPELPVQYADFAVWQRQWWQGEFLETQLAYWKKQLSGAPPLLELPIDRPRPPMQSFRGAEQSMHISAELAESLRALSRQEGVTVFMVMLAAFKVLLSRYSGQEDILVGTGIANRRSREMEGMLGMIINTVVMRTDLSGNITFRELLKRVRQVCLDAYAHQDMPFEKLVEELQPQRSLSYMPLFQVFFGFLDTPMRNMELPGLTLELMEAHNNSAKFDLNVIFILHAEQRIGITDDPVSHEITGLFEYNTDIFKDETITRLVRHYQTLLESVVANPEQPLADLELLPPDERHLMLNEWNQTAKDYSQDKCIHQLFERQVEKSPDAAAVIFEDVELTYTELNRRANQLAHQLRALGIKRGDYVAILAERSLEMVVSVLGITKAGAAYVPLDPAWPEDRLRWMLSSLGVKCILTQTPQLRTIHNLRWQLPSLAHVVLLDTDTPRPPSEKIDREAVEALWNHVAEQSSSDRVLSGGFVSSYTGEAFAEAAVAEYVNRVVKLAEPYLGADKKVLEIGCGAGHIMFEVAPRVAHYTGLDPSAAMQALNRVYADEHGHSNVELLEGFAEQTDSLEAGSYDLVIIASVAQFFPGAVYFTEVIEKSLRLLNAGGTILLADIMDARRKDEFKKSLLTFKSQNPDANTKTQLESELYFEENFFQELQSELPSLDSIEIRRRDEGFANELGYRFDVLLKKTETVADANEQPRQDSRQTNLLTLWHLSSMPEDNPQISVTAEDVAYIIFTSGSTGLPKGVVVQHKPVINLIEWVNGEFQVGAGDVLLFVTSLCFDLSVYDIFGTLAAGATIRVASSKDLRDPQRLVRMLRQEGITFWDSAPAALQHLSPFLTAVNPQEDASRLRLAFLSGDWIPLGLPDLVRSAFPGARVISLGGATEATIWSNFFPIGGIEPHWVSIPYGKPIQNARYHVLDAQLDPSPIGVPGDLYIGGDCLALGYTDAELTARKFIPNPFSTEPGARLYSTGDRARYWPDGNLEFLGRLDSQVKIRGYRIELGEIEAALVSHPAIRECLAMSREDVPGDKRLVAYFICHKDATTPTLADLRAHVREKLPEYMVPAAFVELESIPLTPNGKVDRRALPAPEQNRAETGIEYAAPRTPIEEMLAGIWSEVLGVEQVGIHDNFFELGGHSLLASRLLSRARANFALELPLRALFESPTVSTLASQIETSLRSAHAHDIPPLRRVEREGNLPLSFAQQRLWFIDQLEPSSTAYNIASGVRLLGPLHSSALQQSLQHIVRRHEVLRTSFSTLHGEPVQLIAPSLDFHMEMSDLSTLTEEERARQSQELMEEEAGKAFDLSKSPLMRARLMKMGEEEHVLLLTMHHIISDGWSMGVMVEEVAKLYEGYAKGEEAELPPLTIQYADYATWQREWLQGDVLEQQLSYWREHLAGAPPVLELPTDHPRPPVQSFRGARHRFSLSLELTQALTALSRREGATLFMTLLAAFKTLLYRYSEQESIVVGTPIAGRTEVETEELIGFFVNTLVLRTEIRAEMSVREVIERVKEAALGGYGHQEVPFEKLVEEMAPERSLSHTPLFQVMFALNNTPREAVKLTDLTLQPLDSENQTSKFDLTCRIEEADDMIFGSLSYNTDLFEPSTIERMAGHFERILESMVERPEQRVGEIEMLTEDEQHQLLVEWNQTEAEYVEECVHEMFEAQVERTPDAVAVVFEDEEISYQELNRRANKLAHYLRKEGVEAESLVAVMMERSVEMVVALLGILKAGGAYVSVDPEYPQERVRYMLEDSGAEVLLTQSRLADSCPQITARVVCIDTEWELIAERSDDNLSGGAIDGDNLAYVIYTSGSTGKPKGVMISHRAICNHLSWRQAYQPLTGADSFLQKASFSFDISVWEIFAPLVAGARLVLAQPGGHRDSAYLVREIAKRKITVIHFSPLMLQAFLHEKEVEKCSSLRHVFCGGEPLPSELQEHFFASLKANLYSQYGPTETCVDVTIWKCDSQTQHSIAPIGRPISNTKAYVLDRNLRVVARGIVGELYVGGEGVARGYLKRPEMTAERFIPDPFASEAGARLYRTGDRVRRLADGELAFIGRRDEQVKVRGYRIELGEIEAVLSEHENVREAVVVARKSASEGVADNRLVAYVVGAGVEGINVAELRSYMEGRLPQYMVPSVFVEMESIPLTPNGKIDRRALPELNDERPRLEVEYVAPRTAIEEALAGIWSEVLGVDRVGAYDNFFELGGHSLLATKVISRVSEAFNVELPLRRLFESPTVSFLASIIEQSQSEQKGRAIPKIQTARRGGKNLEQLLTKLDQLSEHEVATILREKSTLLNQEKRSLLEPHNDGDGFTQTNG